MNGRILIRLKGGLATPDPSTIPKGVELEIRDFDILNLSGDTVKTEGDQSYIEHLYNIQDPNVDHRSSGPSGRNGVGDHRPPWINDQVPTRRVRR